MRRWVRGGRLHSSGGHVVVEAVLVVSRRGVVGRWVVAFVRVALAAQGYM